MSRTLRLVLTALAVGFILGHLSVPSEAQMITRLFGTDSSGNAVPIGCSGGSAAAQTPCTLWVTGQ